MNASGWNGAPATVPGVRLALHEMDVDELHPALG